MRARTHLRIFSKKESPRLFDSPRANEIVAACWEFTKELADLKKRGENSIWAFIVRNAYRPAMLTGRFDYIIGNPPWLSYRFIKDPEYQQEVRRRILEEYKIAPSAVRLRAHLELATVFLLHTHSW